MKRLVRNEHHRRGGGIGHLKLVTLRLQEVTHNTTKVGRDAATNNSDLAHRTTRNIHRAIKRNGIGKRGGENGNGLNRCAGTIGDGCSGYAGHFVSASAEIIRHGHKTPKKAPP